MPMVSVEYKNRSHGRTPEQPSADVRREYVRRALKGPALMGKPAAGKISVSAATFIAVVDFNFVLP